MSEPTDDKTKMTKQGVRDLNHQFPKKRPATLEVTAPVVDGAPVAVIEPVALVSSEP